MRQGTTSHAAVARTAGERLRGVTFRTRVVSVLGVMDSIKQTSDVEGAQVCGTSWAALFAATGLGAENEGKDKDEDEEGRVQSIWPSDVKPPHRTIWTARLFPAVAVPNEQERDGTSSTEASSGSGLASPEDDAASLWLLDLGNTENPSSLRGTPAVEAWRRAHRMSLRDLLQQADAEAEFRWRRAVRARVDVEIVASAVRTKSDVTMTQLLRRLAATTGSAGRASAAGTGAPRMITSIGQSMEHNLIPESSGAARALRALEAVAADDAPDVGAQALAIGAQLMWAVAGWGTHQHFSGPASHPEWELPLRLLQAGEPGRWTSSADAAADARRRAVPQLRALRQAWSGTSHSLGRAARHYERASQLVTAQSVYTASTAEEEEGDGKQGAAHSPVKVGEWVVATAPVRVDLAGGWSDTPPITYEAQPGSASGAAAAAPSTDSSAAASSEVFVDSQADGQAAAVHE